MRAPGMSQPALAGPFGGAPGRSVPRSVRRGSAVDAQTARRDTLDGVVQIIAHVPQDARTASTLGTERQGTGVVIDDSGLVLTIGYLVLEAMEIRSRPPRQSRCRRARRLRSRDRLRSGARRATAGSDPDPARRLGRGAAEPAADGGEQRRRAECGRVYVVDRRDFAGYWEYLLEDAIFTAPPHGEFGGAALLDRDGRLVGIGSLWSTTRFQGPADPGQHVRADRPAQADHGRSVEPRPARRPRAAVARGYPGGGTAGCSSRASRPRARPRAPASRPDVILGIDGVQVHGLMDFYRALWARGQAVEVRLDVLKGWRCARW